MKNLPGIGWTSIAYFIASAISIRLLCYIGVYICKSAENIALAEAFIPYAVVIVAYLVVSFCVAAAIALLRGQFLNCPIIFRCVYLVAAAAFAGSIPVAIWRSVTVPVSEIFHAPTEYLIFGVAGILAMLFPQLVSLFFDRVVFPSREVG